MPYVIIVRDRFEHDSISFVWHGGETLKDAQRRRDLLENRLRDFSGSGPKHTTSIFKIAEEIPVWERG